jgi:transposase-like protein
MTVRKEYSKEFKLDAISLVLKQGYSRRASRANPGHSLTVVADRMILHINFHALQG